MNNVENINEVNKLMMAPAFWTFLSVRYGEMCTSSVQAGALTCRLLKLENIYELPFERQARVEWENMMADFQVWLKKVGLR